MKLYATITSERASKGQGGKYLDITIQDEKKETVSRLFVQTTLEGSPIIASWNKTKPFEMEAYSSLISLIHHYTEDTKGKKQKGEAGHS